MRRLRAVLDLGFATPEHAAFVVRLARAPSGRHPAGKPMVTANEILAELRALGAETNAEWQARSSHLGKDLETHRRCRMSGS